MSGPVSTPRRRTHAASDAVLTLEAIRVGAAFRNYSRHVAATAYRVLRNRSDAEDVVQEVFLDAVRGLEHLRNETAVRAWLTAVTIRAATQRRRSRAASVPYGFDDDIVHELLQSDDDHESRGELSALAGIIDGLPEALRLPWRLHCLEGLGLPEVARTCACSVATAKRRIALVRARIAARRGVSPDV